MTLCAISDQSAVQQNRHLRRRKETLAGNPRHQPRSPQHEDLEACLFLLNRHQCLRQLLVQALPFFVTEVLRL